MPNAPKIWLLRAGGKRNLSLIPGSLEYFHSHFVSEPMAENWQPPTFEVFGKSKRLRDFVGLTISAPVVSDRIRKVLEPICNGDVEFLPLHKIIGKDYFAMNVLRTQDVLDLARCETSSSGGKVVFVRTFAFRADLPRSLPPVFKTPEGTGDIFVTEAFKKVALDYHFTGLALADPAVDNFAKTVRGESLNVVDGIAE